MSAICFCFVPRGGNRQPYLRQSMPANRSCVGYLFALCFSRCQWKSLDGGLNLRSRGDDQRHPRDTLLSQDLFLLLPLPQLLAVPSASLLASRFRPRNLILILLDSKVAVCASREPSSVQHVRRTMPCSSSSLPDRISTALLESSAEYGVLKL